MSMRSQVYEWDATDYAITPAVDISGSVGRKISIFVGGLGNNITKPAETSATEFVVIEDVAVTPTAFVNSGTASDYRGLTGSLGTGMTGPRAFVQVRINTTDYFLDPDNVPNDGIPGSASPYPRSVNFQPWDVLVTWYNNAGLPTNATACVSGSLRCFTKYTLYDGPDALIANKLLEMGISINPGNVDWYKRSLLSAQ